MANETVINPYSNPHRKRLWRLGFQDAIEGKGKDAHLAGTVSGQYYTRGYEDGLATQQPKDPGDAG